MSIRKLTCPGCDANLNVPVSMANVKCSACGTIFNAANPAAAQRAPGAASPKNKDSKPAEEPNESKKPNPIVLAGLALGVLLLTLGVGISAVMFSSDDNAGQTEAASTTKTNTTAKTSTAATQDASAEETPTYRVVKLPEPDRKRIYADYRALAKSSIEKKLMIPKSSVAKQTLDSTLQGIVDREIQRFAVLHGVNEDDIRQVIAEGEAKGW